MGTRGLYGFKKNDVEKVTYCHYDSYPDYLGRHISQFVMATSPKEMREIFDKIIMVDEDKKATDEQVAECLKYADTSVGTQNAHDWYCLLRDTQGNLFPYKEDLRYMLDGSMYGGIEYIYLIDLDSETLVVANGGGNILKEIPLDKVDESWVDTVS